MSFETRQETIKNLLTCGICRKLCRDFTIIDECCHTFCRKCITKKITEENLQNCPKCSADLGCAPLQRLKADYRLQNLRNSYVGIRKKLIEHKLMKPRAKDLAREASLNDEANNNKPPVVAAAAAFDVKGKGKEVDDQVSDRAQSESLIVDRKGKGKVIEPSNEAMGPHLVPSVEPPSPTRRKKKSISSLVSANQIAAPARRRRKYSRRKVRTRRASLSDMETICPDANNLLENHYALETSEEQMPINDQQQGEESLERMNDFQTAASVRGRRKYARRKSITPRTRRPSLSGLEPSEVEEEDLSPNANNLLEENPYALEPSEEVEEMPINNSQENNIAEEPLEGIMKDFQTAPPAARGRRKYNRRKTKAVPPRRSSLSGMEPVQVDDEDLSPNANHPQGTNPYVPESSEQQMPTNTQENDQGEPLEEMNDLLTSVDELSERVLGKSRPRRSRKGRRPRKEVEKNGLVEDLNIPTQVVIDSSSVCGRNRRIWFQLVGCKKQESSGLLTPMPPRYIAVGDVNMPASIVKKYLVAKLGRESEDEVKISMRDQLIHPDIQMHELIEMWIKTATRPERRKIVAVGSSGEDFVMVFTYSLQLQS